MEKFIFLKACFQVNVYLRPEKSMHSSDTILSRFLKKDIFL
jgi:hypothetical protein